MAPRTEEQNKMLKDERREQILSGALKVFAMRGFSATRIQDIAKESGISHGLIYHYFKSKEDIFFELVARAVHGAAQSLVMVKNMPISPLEKVRQTARYILDAIDQGRETSYYYLIVIHAAVMDSASEEKNKLFAKMDEPTQAFMSILAEGQAKGEIAKSNPADMAFVFFAAIQGIAVSKLMVSDFKMPDAEVLVHMVKKKG